MIVDGYIDLVARIVLILGDSSLNLNKIILENDNLFSGKQSFVKDGNFLKNFARDQMITGA